MSYKPWDSWESEYLDFEEDDHYEGKTPGTSLMNDYEAELIARYEERCAYHERLWEEQLEREHLAWMKREMLGVIGMVDVIEIHHTS